MLISSIMSVPLIIALISSIMIVISKRKRAGITGIKSALMPICFYAMAVINLLASWFNVLGIISWSLTIILLILGAYFTKYIPFSKEGTK